MSERTLTDELRSVLLFHAMEAPEPSVTVDRILNDTVGAAVVLGAPGTPAEPVAGTGSRRPSSWQLVAAGVVAVVLLAAAGINSQRARHAADSASQRAAGSAASGSAARGSAASRGGSKALPNAFGQPQAGAAQTPTYQGNALNCASIRGGRLVTGQSDDYVSPTGELNYIVEFLCVGPNGERSASELQVFQQVDGRLRYRRTLLSPAAGEHLDFLTAGAASARAQFMAYRTTAGWPAGTVLSTTWDLSLADPGAGYTFPLADPCGRTDLDRELTVAATLAALPGTVPAWRLTVRNTGPRACGLEGFPVVRAQRGGRTLATALPTLSGPA
ncbi:MAG: hypothetical protein JO144_07805, partial [Actinobacteria bacterium]|nr:hypothetical protein [Actinomycetota bacterium]